MGHSEPMELLEEVLLLWPAKDGSSFEVDETGKKREYRRDRRTGVH